MGKLKSLCLLIGSFKLLECTYNHSSLIHDYYLQVNSNLIYARIH
jgi:hypothetical protein